MGITIKTSKRGFDMGYGGFMRFRNKVAECVGNVFYEHYKNLSNAPFYGEERTSFFKTYDYNTKMLINNGHVSLEIADFCYQPDCEGKINKEQAKMIYDFIKDCDDELIYGYSGRDDCCKMKHMKQLFKDCYSDSKQVVWWW